MTDQPQQPQLVPAERDGSRWIYSKPPQDDVVAWFREQHLHADMEHDPYLGGIVLIPATEKVRETRRMPNGVLTPFEFERIVYTPYVKVDTRIAYFWDFVRALNGGKLLGEFVGVIEPVEQKVISDEKSPYFNAHLPQGFSVYVVRNKNDTVSRYIVSTMRVAVYERQAYAARVKGDKPMPLLVGEDSKQTAVLNRQGWADDFAIMKARTGATGRALGVAGILVVGTGVATAEDMQEATSGSAQAGAVEEDKPVALPAVVGAAAHAAHEAATAAEQPSEDDDVPPEVRDQQLRETAVRLRGELQSRDEGAWDRYVAWWQERGFTSLDELNGPALKGAVVKLQRDLDALG